MVKNYFKIAWRNLRKDKVFTGLNLFGLSVAFGVAILLSTYALFELSFDQFHEKANNIYRVYSTDQDSKGAQASTTLPIPFAGALKEEVPGVEHITRYIGANNVVMVGDKELRMGTTFVDPDFLSMFSFPVIKGQQEPLSERFSVAITENAAARIFGEQEALGKTLNLLLEGKEVLFNVAAIVKDFPDQSSFKFDILINFTNLPDFVYGDNLDVWDKSNHEVFLELSENTTPVQFEKATVPFTNLHYKTEMGLSQRDGAQPNSNGNYKQFRLLPFTAMRFTTFENGIAKISRTLPLIVLGIAFLILFIASVNFTNMSIAKSAQRLREIGMRKTLGASKTLLFLQFWGESILIFTAAMILGGLLAGYLIEPFKTLFNTSASFDALSSPFIIAGAILVVLFITFIAGGYPAVLLSKLGTVQALKGKMESTGKNKVRNSLMVIQFGITIILISGTLVLWKQLEFLRNKDLGYNKEEVLAFPLNGKLNSQRAMQLLRNELKDKPGIVSISAANNILGLGKDGSTSTSVLGFDYEGRGIRTNMLIVEHDYIETLELELLDGRTFSRQFSDSSSVLINEAMMREMDEENALHKVLDIDESLSFTIVGVIRDYNFQNLHKEIEPLTLFLNNDREMRQAFVKVTPANISGSFEQVRTAWKKIEPQAEFLGSFLDENVDRTLRRERTMTTMITSGSIIGIILSCTGLFAISLLVVAQRRKEIGIRKVVGASVSRITLMITLEFLKLVGISFIIAAPAAWYYSRKWIQDYPYRIDLNIWIFISAGLIAIFIAVLTVSFQALKAATSNPVNSLKSE